jgi:hypothetical protein
LYKEVLNEKMREFQTQYILEKVGSTMAIQNFVAESSKVSTQPNKLRTLQLATNISQGREMITGIMEYDRINNNGNFDSSVFTEKELNLLNLRQQEGRVTCKRR